MASSKHVSVALLVVGVALLGLSAVPIGEPDVEYVHSVKYAGAEYDGEEVTDYANLTERGQAVFDRARGQEEYVVENESATAPDFDYASDAFSVGYGIYPIRYGGEVYELTTSRTGGAGIAVGLAQIAQHAFRVGGAVVLAVGVIVAAWHRLGRAEE